MPFLIRIADYYKSDYSRRRLNNKINTVSELNISTSIIFGEIIKHKLDYNTNLVECFLAFNTELEATEFMLHYN